MEQRLEVQCLRPGQVAARDVHARDGALLVPRGTALTQTLIDRIAEERLDAVWVQATRPVDGSFRLFQKKDGLLLTVTPPKEGGTRITLEQVKAELERRKLARIDWKRCEQAVKEARGVPVNIIARDGMFVLEVDEEGLFLTVYPAVSGGEKVSVFQVRKEVESKRYHMSDEKQAQRVVAGAAGRREKIGEAQGRARVQVSADRLTAEMIVTGPNGGSAVDEEGAKRALEEARVTQGIVSEEVAAAVREENWGRPFTVARGEAAAEGTEGQIVERHAQSKTRALLEAQLGCRILEPSQIVEKGEVLVEKTPAVPGKDGVDVFGNALRQRRARDPELPRAGTGVERSADGLRLTATGRGTPSSRGHAFAVEPIRGAVVEAGDLERALEAGGRLLGIARDALGHEVQQEGHKGVLGIGAAAFRVRVFPQETRRLEPAKPAEAPRPKVLESTDEKPKGTVRLASDENGRREISLHADPGRVHLYLAVRQKADPVAVAPDEVRTLMEKAAIVLPDEERARIDGFLAALAGEPLEVPWKRLASGRAPVPGRDAPVTWAVDVAEDRVEGEEQADYYEITKFANVAQGALLFTLGEPEPGVDGIDVHGRPVPAPPGRAVPLKTGLNVRYDEDGKRCFAAADGAVLVKNATVSVEAVFRVKGDVDFHVGNVDFNGVVDVSGNILDDFKVRAARDIAVGGNIEGADVEVGGNLRVRQGITGHNKGRVWVRGKVEAKYINGASVIAEGDVIVRVQILHSTVLSRGRIIVERGGIVGGRTAALLEVRSPEIGSEMGVKTEVSVGVDLAGTARVQEIDESLRDLDEKIGRVGSSVAPFVENPELLNDLSEEKRDAVRKLLQRLEAMKVRRGGLAEERERLIAPSDREIRPVISLLKRAFQNVDLRAGPVCRMRLDREMNGPVKLRPNEETGTLESYRT